MEILSSSTIYVNRLKFRTSAILMVRIQTTRFSSRWNHSWWLHFESQTLDILSSNLINLRRRKFRILKILIVYIQKVQSSSRWNHSWWLYFESQTLEILSSSTIYMNRFKFRTPAIHKTNPRLSSTSRFIDDHVVSCYKTMGIFSAWNNRLEGGDSNSERTATRRRGKRNREICSITRERTHSTCRTSRVSFYGVARKPKQPQTFLPR